MKPQAGLIDVYVARAILTPPCARDTIAVNRLPAICCRLHRVHWRETRMSADGAGMILRFRAPDAESVRVALRHARIRFDSIWTGERRAAPRQSP